ncbi:hypothetical protein D3C75_1116670 [compost metagenome]
MDIIFLLAAQIGYTSQNYISDNTKRDSVGNIVRKRHNGKGQEGWNRIYHILKVNFTNGLSHNYADNNQGCGSS